MANFCLPVGANAIVEVFFLHERGRAFGVYFIANLIGSTAGPTFSGFITNSVPWPWQYWYNVILEGLVVLLTFFFLHETGYSRDSSTQDRLLAPEGFVANRIATFVTGKVVPRHSSAEMWHRAVAPFLTGISPVGLMGGMVLFVNFGWGVGVNTLLAIFLQSPVEVGGYGFTPEQNAYCEFSLPILPIQEGISPRPFGQHQFLNKNHHGSLFRSLGWSCVRPSLLLPLQRPHPSRHVPSPRPGRLAS